MTLFEIKEKMQTLTDAINADREFITSKAADPASDLKEVEEKEAHLASLQKRYDLLKVEHDRMEEAQRTQVAMKSGSGAGMTEKEVLIKAKAEFYKAALTGKDVRKAYEGLGAIPVNDADLGRGENLLPTNLDRELLVEPFQTNSLRDIEQVSQITGLEEAKLDYTIEDADLADVTDKATAHEIELEGSSVSYGRFKTKVSATIKDTVLHGSPFDLVSTVESALRSALAVKEKMRAFGTDSSDTTHAHMSFYLNNIAEVKGDNVIDAIINALGDLPDAFLANAAVVMRRQDYFAAIRNMANNSDTLWGKKPEDVIGYPVVFNDKAIYPVVGDFRFARQNYDIGSIYETDKDGKKGEYYFIFTAWGDHRIKLKSAFRIAKIRVTITGATAAAATAAKAAGEKLTVAANSLRFSDGGSGAGGIVSYVWQYLSGGEWVDADTWTGQGTNELTTVDSQDEGVSFRCKVCFADADGESFVITNFITMT